MKRAAQKDVVILAARRTPRDVRWRVKDLTATDLAVHAAVAAIAQAACPRRTTATS